jgi:hypothetical protein
MASRFVCLRACSSWDLISLCARLVVQIDFSYCVLPCKQLGRNVRLMLWFPAVASRCRPKFPSPLICSFPVVGYLDWSLYLVNVMESLPDLDFSFWGALESVG